MYSEEELKNFIDELSQGKHSFQNCERLAAVYIVMDHLHKQDPGIDDFGDSEFFNLIRGKDQKKVFNLLDEFLSIIHSINPNLYNSLMTRLEGID